MKYIIRQEGETVGLFFEKNMIWSTTCGLCWILFSLVEATKFSNKSNFTTFHYFLTKITKP